MGCGTSNPNSVHVIKSTKTEEVEPNEIEEKKKEYENNILALKEKLRRKEKESENFKNMLNKEKEKNKMAMSYHPPRKILHEETIEKANTDHRELAQIQEEREKLDEEWAQIQKQKDKIDEKMAEIEEKAKIDYSEKIIDEDKDRFDDEMLEINEEKARIDQEKTRLNEEKAEIDDEKARLDEEKAEIDEERVEIDEEKARLEEKKVKIDEEKELIDEKIAEIDQEKTIIDYEKSQIEEEKYRLDEERAEIDEEKTKLDEERAEIDEEKAKLDEERAEIDNEKAKLDEERAEIDNEKTRLNDKIAIIDGEKAKIDYEKAKIDEEKVRLDEVMAKIEDKNVKLYNDKVKIEEEKAKLDKEQVRICNDEKGNIDERQNKLDEEKAKLDEQKAEIDHERAEIDQEKAKVDEEKAKIDEEKARLHDEIAEIEEEKKKVDEKLKEANLKIESYKKALISNEAAMGNKSSEPHHTEAELEVDEDEDLSLLLNTKMDQKGISYPYHQPYDLMNLHPSPIEVKINPTDSNLVKEQKQEFNQELAKSLDYCKQLESKISQILISLLPDYSEYMFPYSKMEVKRDSSLHYIQMYSHQFERADCPGYYSIYFLSISFNYDFGIRLGVHTKSEKGQKFYKVNKYTTRDNLGKIEIYDKNDHQDLNIRIYKGEFSVKNELEPDHYESFTLNLKKRIIKFYDKNSSFDTEDEDSLYKFVEKMNHPLSIKFSMLLSMFNEMDNSEYKKIEYVEEVKLLLFTKFSDYYNKFYKNENGEYQPSKINTIFNIYYKESAKLLKNLDYEGFEDSYQTTKKLGSGSFGSVYLAKLKIGGVKLEEDKVDIAVKVINKSDISVAKQYNIIKNETDLLQKLDSPNLMKCIYMYEKSDSFVVFYELLPGMSLDDLLKNAGGALPIDTIRFLAAEMIKALNYLRQVKVVHRDIKPENVMLDQFFHFKLADFGLAISDEFGIYEKEKQRLNEMKDTIKDQICQDEAKEDDEFEFSSMDFMQSMKTHHEKCGTPAYFSPEMRYCKVAMHAADIFALGCMLYKCFTGKEVIEANTLGEIRCGKINYEEIKDKNGRAFVQECLIPSPFERLGGEDEDLESVAFEQPFFTEAEGFDSEKVHEMIPSIPSFLISQTNKLLNE